MGSWNPFKQFYDYSKDAFDKVGDAWNDATDWVDENVTFGFIDDPKPSYSDIKESEEQMQQQPVNDLMSQVTDIDPYSINWDEGMIYDQDGNPVKDYSEYYDRIQEAASANIPSIDEYMATNDYQFNDPLAKDADGNYINPTMQNVTGLTEELRGGPTDAEMAEAQEYAAQQLGLTTDEYQTMLRDMTLSLEGGVNSMEGMSEEERALRERANRSDLRQMETRAARQIENIQASTGSTSRSLAAADEAMRSINDSQIQQQVALADETFRRQMAQYEGQQQQWQQMVQNNQMSQSEYLNLVQNSKAAAFKGYAMEIDTMFEQNQEYLSRYESDLKAVSATLDNTYKAVMTEMGVDASMMDFVEQQYNMEMAPLLTQIDLLLAQQGIASEREAQDQSETMDYLTLAVQFLGVVI